MLATQQLRHSFRSRLSNFQHYVQRFSTSRTEWEERTKVFGLTWNQHNLDAASDACKGNFEWLHNIFRSSVSIQPPRKETPLAASFATKSLCTFYSALDPVSHSNDRTRFLVALAGSLRLDNSYAQDAIVEQAHAGSPPTAVQVRNIRAALTPPYEEFFQQVTSHVPSGVPLLVQMREDLLHAKHTTMESEEPGSENGTSLLDELDATLKSYLTILFKTGLLELRRISLESPGTLLQKLIEYEKVHLYKGLTDLQRRFGHGRRCFGFFHPSIKDEPLVFVHVALVDRMAPSMRYLDDQVKLHGKDESHASAAIFYSISATQPGLRGVDLGVFLIKRVVDILREEFPNLRVFSTLSPIPGFLTWLRRALKDGQTKLLHSEKIDIDNIPKDNLQLLLGKDAENVSSSEAIVELCLSNPSWVRHDWAVKAFERPLTRLAAVYLANVKHHRNSNVARCPVANFHIRNGAVLERINYMADLSTKGVKNSAGVMVNYHYVLNRIDENSDMYTRTGQIPTAFQVKRLLMKES